MEEIDHQELEAWAIEKWGDDARFCVDAWMLCYACNPDSPVFWLCADELNIGDASGNPSKTYEGVRTMAHAKAVLWEALRTTLSVAPYQRNALEEWAIDMWGDSEGFTSDGDILRVDDDHRSPAFVWSAEGVLYRCMASPSFNHRGIFTLDHAKDVLLAELGPPKAKQPLADATQPLTADEVASPSHYTQGGVECIEGIRAALGEEGFRAFCRGCAIKYLWRAGLKGSAKTDLEKAAKYIQFALEGM